MTTSLTISSGPLTPSSDRLIALVSELAPPDALPSANALTSIGIQSGRILGPTLAAVIVASGGPVLAFAVDAGSFVILALLLLPLLWLHTPQSTPGWCSQHPTGGTASRTSHRYG